MLSCHRKKLEFISITISQGSLHRATSISIQDHLQGKANRPVGHIFIKSQHLPETSNKPLKLHLHRSSKTNVI